MSAEPHPSWAELYMQYRPLMYRIACGMLRVAGLDAGMAADVVHDAWKKLLKHDANTINTIKDPAAYISTATRNCATDLINSTVRRATPDGLDPGGDTRYGAAPDPPVDEQVERRMLAVRLLQLLDRLSQRERDAFIGRLVCAQPATEVADALGCTERNVGFLVTKATRKLNAMLHEEGWWHGQQAQ